MNNVLQLFADDTEYGGGDGGGGGYEEIVCAKCEANNWKIYWDENPLIVCQDCCEEHILPAYEK